VERLRTLGWIEGRTIAIEYRWAEGSNEQAAKIAAEFVRLKVDAIVTNGTSTYTVKQATSSIPIVFPMANDPVAAGLVASLARPGGNITGLSNMQSDVVSKKLELLREAIPRLRRLALMFNADYSDAVLEMRAAEALAGTLGLELTPLEIRRAEDVGPAFEQLKVQTDALYVDSLPPTAHVSSPIRRQSADAIRAAGALRHREPVAAVTFACAPTLAIVAWAA
jgi:putative ABC transport system substrate-binding protein